MTGQDIINKIKENKWEEADFYVEVAIDNYIVTKPIQMLGECYDGIHFVISPVKVSITYGDE